jgi:eukaryotic-like serine/threonine-protein kinase
MSLPPAGAEFAGYRLEELLASGAVGATHRARTADGACVALKLIDLDADPAAQARRRFEREATIAARLRHPGIVEGRGHGVEGRFGWIATVFVPGGDLRRWLGPATPAWSPARALELGAGLARALDHAHRQGVVHRDLKPSNVLVDREQDAFLLADFGIAALQDGLRSRTGVLPGSPAYMAPELLAGGAPTVATDVYGLAATLYELLAGRPPHQADTLGALMRALAREPAPPLRQWRPSLPAACDAALAPALDRDPARRPRSAAALADALAEAARAADGLP